MGRKLILQTLVGSRAHGLHDDNSDYDYRGVFVQSTAEILSLNYKPSPVSWIEDKEDQTSYEIAHFLSLACRSNPSILEVMVAPIIEADEYGNRLRGLFSSVWNSKDVYNAFTGYSHNQLKKLIDSDKFPRSEKYAVAYLRVLMMAEDLLTNGSMSLEIKNFHYKEMLLGIKKGSRSKGWILNQAEFIREKIYEAYYKNPSKQTDYDVVNNFLLDVRKGYW